MIIILKEIIKIILKVKTKKTLYILIINYIKKMIIIIIDIRIIILVKKYRR